MNISQQQQQQQQNHQFANSTDEYLNTGMNANQIRRNADSHKVSANAVNEYIVEK